MYETLVCTICSLFLSLVFGSLHNIFPGCRKKRNKMKQKVVLKVAMNCEKCRIKALKMAAEQEGVEFIGLEGAEKDKVVVIGDGVDAVKLTTNLRKKVGHTEIISLAPQK